MHTAQIVGAACLDLQPQMFGQPITTPGALAETGPLIVRPGGPVSNTSRLIAALGAPVHLVANIGDDELGRLLCDLLIEEHGPGQSLAVIPGTSASYSLVVQPPGRDRTYWLHVGANASFDGSQVDVRRADLMHLGYPSMLPVMTEQLGRPLRELFTLARAAEVTTSLDLSYIDPMSPAAAVDWSAVLRGLLPEVDILSPSIDDLTSALGWRASHTLDDAAEAGRRLVDLGAGIVMVTAAEAGLVVCTGSARRLEQSSLLAPLADRWAEQKIRVPAVPVSVADSSCAGDAATAGLLYGVLVGLDLPTIAHLAATVAAQHIRGDRTFGMILRDQPGYRGESTLPVRG